MNHIEKRNQASQSSTQEATGQTTRQIGRQITRETTQELRDLLALSTGSIDAYIIESFAKVPMLLPQNIVLAALDSATNVEYVQWHEDRLPLLNMTDTALLNGVALVIESEDSQQRFALLSKTMPRAIRIRISDMVDEETQPILDLSIKHYVRIGEEIYHVPDMKYIENQLFTK